VDPEVVPQAAKRTPAGAAVLRDDVTSAIRDALFIELAAVGYGRLSIEAVARRAGVGKTAVYRRWSSKLDMVVEMVSAAAGPALRLPDAGSLRADVELVLTMAARALRHPLASQIIPDLLAEAARSPQIAQTLQTVLRDQQRGVSAGLIERAIGRGEIAAAGAPDPDIATDLLVGPLYWHVAVARGALSQAQITRLAQACAVALGSSTDR
jgi:AcrR family transcriptional regulator